MSNKKIAIIGYSGHSYVVLSSLMAAELRVDYYCDELEKTDNPYQLFYLGSDRSADIKVRLREMDYFITIGDNSIRKKIQESLTAYSHPPINVIDPSATLQFSVNLGNGVFIAPNCSVNALSTLGDGVVCNTGSTIEHECRVGKYSFISPGAVLCGNVMIGENTFIGANATIKQGVKIGSDVVIGAGSVVLEDVPDGTRAVGNPIRTI